MLQQTRVAAVLPYYRRFIRRFPTVRALARARTEEVLRYWSGLGHYSRARNLHRAAKEIVARHNGQFPRTQKEALELPGVGPYTAAAVLSMAYSEPLAVLDGNVARVLARLEGLRGDLPGTGRWQKLQARAQELMDELGDGDEWRGKPGATREEQRDSSSRQNSSGLRMTAWRDEGPETEVKRRCRASSPALQRKQERDDAAVTRKEQRDSSSRQDLSGLRMTAWRGKPAAAREEKDAGGPAPALHREAGDWNQAMMELGATVCTPRSPRCDACPVARWCRAYRLGLTDKIPAARKKRAPVRVKVAAAVLLDPRGRTLLVRQNDGLDAALFSGLWQFPAIEVTANGLRELPRQLQVRMGWAGDEKRPVKPLPEVRHSVTFRAVTLLPLLLRVKKLPRLKQSRAVLLAEVNRLAISNATRKIAQAVLENCKMPGALPRRYKIKMRHGRLRHVA